MPRKKINSKNNEPIRLGLVLVLLILFLLDRALKNHFFQTGDFVANRGLAFGLALNQIFLWLIILTVLIGVFHLLLKAYRAKQTQIAAAFSLIALGAVSNLWDRWHWGYVVDYLNWPRHNVFNLADVMILFGVGILVWKTFGQNKK